MTREFSGPGVHRLLAMMVNVFFVSDGAGGWVLIDAGLFGYTDRIRRTALELYGGKPPSAIVLTHGHFDHVGALPTLAEEWGVPVYVHPLEMPYVIGRSSYPPPDPTVGGGLWATLSPTYPRGPVDLRSYARMLPADGQVPALPGWQWIDTPGHSAGHVSFFREADRTLIAGDAVVTTKQESFTSVMTQRAVVWRPPAYYTTDWGAAGQSVRTLAALEPEVLATGHGPTLCGPQMRGALHDLAERFEQVIPHAGRYVREPAVADERGVVYVPPATGVSAATLAVGIAAVAAGAVAVAAWRRSGVH